MKIPSLSLLTITTLCGALVVSANAAPPLGHGPALGAQHSRVAQILRNHVDDLDINNDGKISQEEFLAPRLARQDKIMARMDANGDGLLSLDEMRPAAADRPAGPKRPNRIGRPAIARADVLACVQSSDPDFHLPQAPGNESAESRFSKADTNGDGKLSLAELGAAATARAQAQFQRLDRDNDGFLTTADRKAGQAERAAVAKAVQGCLKDKK